MKYGGLKSNVFVPARVFMPKCQKTRNWPFDELAVCSKDVDMSRLKEYISSILLRTFFCKSPNTELRQIRKPKIAHNSTTLHRKRRTVEIISHLCGSDDSLFLHRKIPRSRCLSAVIIRDASRVSAMSRHPEFSFWYLNVSRPVSLSEVPILSSYYNIRLMPSPTARSAILYKIGSSYRYQR